MGLENKTSNDIWNQKNSFKMASFFVRSLFFCENKHIYHMYLLHDISREKTFLLLFLFFEKFHANISLSLAKYSFPWLLSILHGKY